jgi:hypothetical protein
MMLVVELNCWLIDCPRDRIARIPMVAIKPIRSAYSTNDAPV